jgi:mono/diheme cytochrome c family protein
MEGEVVLKMTKRLTIILLVMTLALAVAGAPAWAANAAAGKTVYTSKCQACHAADGTGNPGLGKALGVTWAPLGGADVQKMSDDDLKKVVTAGKGKMKPIASVTGADLDNVIAYVRTLKK